MSTAPLAPAGGRRRRLLEAFHRALVDPETPGVAVEVRPASVGVVKARRERGRAVLVAAAAVELPEGVLALSMTQPNVADPARFRAALRAAMERAGVLDGARVALVLPDPVARVALLGADDVKSRRAEAEELVRFRLKKGVPFEIRDARLALVRGSAGQALVAVAAPAAILDEYEAACRDVRLEPGQVELAGLALARSAFGEGAAGDRLLVNWDEGYVSFALLRDGWPALFRTLPGPAAASPEEVAREAGQTLLYWRERLGGGSMAAAAVRCTRPDAGAAVAALEEPLGLTPTLVAAWAVPAGASLAVGQGLAGAAAAVGIRA